MNINKLLKLATLFLLIISFLYSCAATIKPSLFIDMNKNVATNIRNEQLFWTSLPIKIMVAYEVSRERYKKIEAAAMDWNISVGCQVFTIERGHWDIRNGTISMSEARLGKTYGGDQILGEATRRYHTDRYEVPVYINYAEIEIWNRLPLNLWQKTVLHELGHGLGLSHDRTKRSVMWPYLNENDGNIMPNDIAFIRKYCRVPICDTAAGICY